MIRLRAFERNISVPERYAFNLAGHSFEFVIKLNSEFFEGEIASHLAFYNREKRT
jgi:hypothetical protein